MKLINFTKDVLHVYDAQGSLVDLPPDPRHLGIVAVGEHHIVEDEAGRRFSLNVRRVTEIKGLPEPNGEAVYIVPIEVAMAVQAARADVVFPAEVTDVRDAAGAIQHITHLRRVVSDMA